MRPPAADIQQEEWQSNANSSRLLNHLVIPIAIAITRTIITYTMQACTRTCACILIPTNKEGYYLWIKIEREREGRREEEKEREIKGESETV